MASEPSPILFDAPGIWKPLVCGIRVKMKKTVEIFPAFTWVCPNCGHKSFDDLVVAELTPDEKREIAIDHDIDSQEFPELLAAPESVECPRCYDTYQTDCRQDERIND